MSASDHTLSPGPTAAPGTDVQGAADPSGAAGGSLFQHLMALQELQANLSQEQQPEAILQVGATAVVEILGADCGVAEVDLPGGTGPLRFGWIEGRLMAKHEIEGLSRSLEEEIHAVRVGDRARILLAAEAGRGRAEPEGEPPAAFQTRRLGSVLVVGVGSGRRKEGTLVLARRNGAPFAREQVALADLLAGQIAAQFERVRRVPEPSVAADVGQEPDGEPASRGLRERLQEMEALLAVQYAVSLSSDAERQLDGALHKAVELTGHAAGALYFIEMTDSGDERLRFAQGIGDRESLEPARRAHWLKGEGPPGRAWESGESVAILDMLNDPGLAGGDRLYRAGYRKILCLPLRARGRVLGVLELIGTDETPYSDADRRLAGGIAEQVALVAHGARFLGDLMSHSLDLEQQVERQRRDLDLRDRRLGGILRAMAIGARPDNPGGPLDGMLGCAVDLLGGAAGAIHLVDPDGGALRLRVRRGFGGDGARDLEALAPDDPVFAAAAGGTAPVEVDLDTIAASSRAAWAGESNHRRLAVAPCPSSAGLRGFLTIATDPARPLEDADREALAAIAGMIGRVAAPPPGPAAPSAPDWPGAALPGMGGMLQTASLQAQLMQAQKMESIGTLAGGIAHNFNNILAGITGHASHIKTLVPDGDPIRRKVEIIEQQSQRAAELTRQLAAFARGGEGRREPVEVNLVIEETVSFLSKSLDPSLVVEALYAPELPMVEADAGQLRQVLLNIAVNARDAMTSGGRITFQSRMGHLDDSFASSIPGLGPGDYVALMISDNGPGMSREVMERVFEPFFTTKPAGSGSGLGLAVAYGIIKNHRGHVAISSTPGVGTAVCIYLPVTDRPAADPQAVASGEPSPDPAAPIEPLRSAPFRIEPAAGASAAAAASFPAPAVMDVDAAAPTGMPDTGEAGFEAAAAIEGDPVARFADAPVAGAGELAPAAPPPTARVVPVVEDRTAAACVLVVDDEAVVRDMAVEILRAGGYEVIMARDGIEALDLYRRHWGEISVVLLDMVMPRLSGLETFRRLLGMDRRARVLLYSGISDSEQAQKAIREGAVGLLSKPFGMGELLGWVARALASKT